jgi:hypothetical protein
MFIDPGPRARDSAEMGIRTRAALIVLLAVIVASAFSTTLA